jgi:hypothetical protein
MPLWAKSTASHRQVKQQGTIQEKEMTPDLSVAENKEAKELAHSHFLILLLNLSPCENNVVCDTYGDVPFRWGSSTQYGLPGRWFGSPLGLT